MGRSKTTSLRVVDTNVPIKANLATRPDEMSKNPSESAHIILSCVLALKAVMQNNALVIDSGNEIFDEYRKNLSLKEGQPGIGDVFLKWVHDNRWGWPEENRVEIHPDGNGSYREFPNHAGLVAFDFSDRKFIAVANAHSKKPPILQAADSKWWGWKEALAEEGISVKFLCPQYVKSTYEKKFPQNDK